MGVGSFIGGLVAPFDFFSSRFLGRGAVPWGDLRCRISLTGVGLDGKSSLKAEVLEEAGLLVMESESDGSGLLLSGVSGDSGNGFSWLAVKFAVADFMAGFGLGRSCLLRSRGVLRTSVGDSSR